MFLGISLSSVAQSCLTLCDPMNCSTPGLPVHHQLPESKPMSTELVMPSNHLILSSPSPPARNLSQNQGLFQWVGSSHLVAKVLEHQLQHQSSQWIIQGWFPLGLTGFISLQSKGLSNIYSSTTVQRHQFFSAQPSLWSDSHIWTGLLEKS